MTSDSVLAISVSVAVTVKGGGGVRNHVYVSINKKNARPQSLNAGASIRAVFPPEMTGDKSTPQIFSLYFSHALYLSKSKA